MTDTVWRKTTKRESVHLCCLEVMNALLHISPVSGKRCGRSAKSFVLTQWAGSETDVPFEKMAPEETCHSRTLTNWVPS